MMVKECDGVMNEYNLKLGGKRAGFQNQGRDTPNRAMVVGSSVPFNQKTLQAKKHGIDYETSYRHPKLRQRYHPPSKENSYCRKRQHPIDVCHIHKLYTICASEGFDGMFP